MFCPRHCYRSTGGVLFFDGAAGLTVCAFATPPAARESPIAWQRTLTLSVVSPGDPRNPGDRRREDRHTIVHCGHPRLAGNGGSFRVA